MTDIDQIAADLTTEERKALADMLAQLRADGYVEIAEHKALRPGTRIRHSGHQWPDALWHGSGIVLAITEKPNSSWSRSWGAPDIELIALWDKPSWNSRLSQLAQHHVIVVGDAGRAVLDKAGERA